jgi:hypothetical protein
VVLPIQQLVRCCNAHQDLATKCDDQQTKRYREQNVVDAARSFNRDLEGQLLTAAGVGCFVVSLVVGLQTAKCDGHIEHALLLAPGNDNVLPLQIQYRGAPNTQAPYSCGITNFFGPLEKAHLVPQEEGAWFLKFSGMVWGATARLWKRLFTILPISFVLDVIYIPVSTTGSLHSTEEIEERFEMSVSREVSVSRFATFNKRSKQTANAPSQVMALSFRG